jgi:hypothetical protein
MTIPKEDLEYLKEHNRTIDTSGFTEDKLNKLGISSIQILAEKTMSPVLSIKYSDGSDDCIYKGYDEIIEKINELVQ